MFKDVIENLGELAGVDDNRFDAESGMKFYVIQHSDIRRIRYADGQLRTSAPQGQNAVFADEVIRDNVAR